MASTSVTLHMHVQVFKRLYEQVRAGDVAIVNRSLWHIRERQSDMRFDMTCNAGGPRLGVLFCQRATAARCG